MTSAPNATTQWLEQATQVVELYRAKEYTKALETARDCERFSVNRFTEAHENTVISQGLTSFCLRLSGESDQAEQKLASAKQNMDLILSTADLSWITLALELSRITPDGTEESKELVSKYYEIVKNHSGSGKHPLVLVYELVLSGMGLYFNERSIDSKEVLKQAIAVAKGKDNPDYLNTLVLTAKNLLTTILLEEEQTQRAIETIQDTIEFSTRVFGESDVHTLDLWSTLGGQLYKDEDYNSAHGKFDLAYKNLDKKKYPERTLVLLYFLHEIAERYEDEAGAESYRSIMRQTFEEACSKLPQGDDAIAGLERRVSEQREEYLSSKNPQPFEALKNELVDPLFMTIKYYPSCLLKS